LNDCFTQVLEMERRLGLLKLGRALTEMLARLERLRKSGLKKLARSDEDARFLRQRGGNFQFGYTGEITISDDHLIVAQRVTQNAANNH
jgi:hypothetical protein